MVVVGQVNQDNKMICLKIMLGLFMVKQVFSDSDSDSEPRYLDQFNIKFGSNSPKPKRQSQEDLEVSAIIGELLREQEDSRFEPTIFAEDRTFPGEDLVRKGAKDLSDDIHAILSDILDGADEDEDQQDLNSLRQELSQEEKRILQSLRDIEEEDQRELTRKPIRFRESKGTSSIFSSSFADEGLRTKEERENGEILPNLSNRGRFNPSAPKPDPVPSRSRTRGSRQQATCKSVL